MHPYRLRGCVYWGDCCYPHVADCASLIVNMGLLRLQPLRGCGAELVIVNIVGGMLCNSRPVRTPEGVVDCNPGLRFAYPGLNASPMARPHMLRMSSHQPSYLGVCNTPLQDASTVDINRGAVTTSITPHWRRRRLCGDTWTSPPIHNRGAVADPAAQLTIYMAGDVPSDMTNCA